MPSHINQMAPINEVCIVGAHDLSPSDTASIDKKLVHGFVTDLGSATSHTAIMAKALEVPAVVGLHNITAVASSDDTILIDGSRGMVYINPTADRLVEYEKRAEEQRQIREELGTLRDKPPETQDGYLVPITANIELLEELDAMDLKASIHRRWRRPFLLGKMAQAERTQGTNTLVVALKGGCCGGKPNEPSVEPPYKLTEVPSTKFRRRPLINPEPVD